MTELTARQREVLARFDAEQAEREAREVERAKEMWRLHRERLAEFEPFVRELHELGMVPGWRAIQKIELLGGE